MTGGAAPAWVRELDIGLCTEADAQRPDYRPAHMLLLDAGTYRVTLQDRADGQPSALRIPGNDLWSAHFHLHFHWVTEEPKVGQEQHHGHATIGLAGQYASPREAMDLFNEKDGSHRLFTVPANGTRVIVYAFIDQKNNKGGARMLIEAA